MDGEPVRHETYVAYMLRLWRAGSHGGQPVWRASLENAHSGERLAFSDTKSLFAFLADLMASPVEISSGPGATEPGKETVVAGPSVARENPGE